MERPRTPAAVFIPILRKSGKLVGGFVAVADAPDGGSHKPSAPAGADLPYFELLRLHVESALENAFVQRELRRQIELRSEGLATALGRLTEVRTNAPFELQVGDVLNERYRVTGILGRGGMGWSTMSVRSRSGRALDEHRPSHGDRSWAATVLQHVAEGLAAIHESGIVHRDLKPANVLLADAGGGAMCAKIADLGVSKLALPAGAAQLEHCSSPSARPRRSSAPRPSVLPGPGKWRASLTEEGVVIGTPKYMAPESVLGRVAEPAADVFAFGVMALELLTGVYPFEQPPAVCLMHEQRLPVLPCVETLEADPALAALLAARVQYDASLRPTARALADELRRIVTSQSPSAPRPVLREPPTPRHASLSVQPLTVRD